MPRAYEYYDSGPNQQGWTTTTRRTASDGFGSCDVLEVPDDLWARYKAAVDALEAVEEEMRGCPEVV